jgi:phosphotransferase system enzyme I (PtsI)
VVQTILHGIPVSAGISIGKVYFMHRAGMHVVSHEPVHPDRLGYELERLDMAFDRARQELKDALDKVPPELKEHASLIDSHLMILADPKLQGSARRILEEQCIEAEWALDQAVERIADVFAAIEDPYIRERIQDVRAVSERVMNHLALLDRDNGAAALAAKPLSNRVVLMANDLTPADTIEIEVEKIMSLATEQGGKTSHTGILARSLQIPAVVGVSGLCETVKDGDLVIVDGLNGKVIVNPEEAVLGTYGDLKYQFEKYHQTINQACQLPAETTDGFRIMVYANIELAEEVTAALDHGGEGIGLYRTEYAFMHRRQLPTEEELYEEYKDLASICAPRRVVFRTLDVGGDKIVGVEPTDEANPAMGLRAIRFCLRHEELFKRQIRAILRAALHGNAALMFPMISGLRELNQAKFILAKAQRELEAEGVPYAKDMPIGMMVELPSAVVIAEMLAPEVDFFSIGTNDLIQYSLGIDRTNRYVSYLYQPLHPAVVRSIKHVVDAGHREGIEVNVCGELASDPYCVPILMGMQVDGLSIAPQAIPGIKRIIRQATLEECKDLLRDVLAANTVSKINRQVKETVFKRFPEEVMFFSSLLDLDEG